jgi:hypothetical protein
MAQLEEEATIVVDIEIADRPHDDPDYMEDVIQNMIDNGSPYFA